METTQPDFTTARSANGEQLIQWLRAQRLLTPDPLQPWRENLPASWHKDRPSIVRSINRWKHGAHATFDAVDRLAVALDRHVSELPPEIWRDTDARAR